MSAYPVHSQKRMLDRMNRTLCSDSKLTLAHSTAPEHGKISVLKKIFAYLSPQSAFHLSSRRSRKFSFVFWR